MEPSPMKGGHLPSLVAGLAALVIGRVGRHAGSSPFAAGLGARIALGLACGAPPWASGTLTGDLPSAISIRIVPEWCAFDSRCALCHNPARLPLLLSGKPSFFSTSAILIARR
jgi:hypothetical protein